MNYSLCLKSLMVALALATFSAITPLAAQNTAGAVPNIEFLGETYSLAWTSDPTPGYSKAEYLPEDEALPYYANMLLVEKLFNGMDLTQVVRAQVEFIKNFNQSEKGGTGSEILNLIENPSTGEVLLMFMMSAPDEHHGLILEWNAYRYSPIQGADGTQGVRLFGYSKRNYGRDSGVQVFLEQVDNRQSEFINAVVSAELP